MESGKIVEALSALAHEHRLAVYRMLVEAGPAGLSAGVIAERLTLAPSSLSFHTQTLVRAGIATQRRVSRQLIYAADFTAMNELVFYLTENCCGIGKTCAPACDPAATDLISKEARGQSPGFGGARGAWPCG